MKKTSLALLGALFAGNVFAQATPTPQPGPGWEIVWGVGVPISPIASVLIAISLAGATYAFARRKRGQSLIALCVAAIAGVFAISDNSLAVAEDFDFTIPSKSGATIISCNSFAFGAADDRKLAADPGSFEVLIGTSVDEGVTLTTVRQIGVAPSSANTVQPQGAGPLLCQAGMLVTKETPCYVPCPGNV